MTCRGATCPQPTDNRWLCGSWSWLALTLAAAGVLPACSGFDGGGDLPPEVNSLSALPGDGSADGTADGASVRNPDAADWSCLGAPPSVSPGIGAGGLLHYSILLRSMLGLPITNLVMRACEAPDLDCLSPVAESRSGLNAEGLAEMD